MSKLSGTRSLRGWLSEFCEFPAYSSEKLNHRVTETQSKARQERNDALILKNLCASVSLWLKLFPYSKQRLAVFDRLAVLDVDLYDLAGDLGLDLVHKLHRLDYTDDRIRGDLAAFLHVRFLVRSGGTVKRADDR